MVRTEKENRDDLPLLMWNSLEKYFRNLIPLVTWSTIAVLAVLRSQKISKRIKKLLDGLDFFFPFSLQKYVFLGCY